METAIGKEKMLGICVERFFPSQKVMAAINLADAVVENVSAVMSFGQMSEIFFMLVIPLLFRHPGVKYMLLVGICAWFLAWKSTGNPAGGQAIRA